MPRRRRIKIEFKVQLVVEWLFPKIFTTLKNIDSRPINKSLIPDVQKITATGCVSPSIIYFQDAIAGCQQTLYFQFFIWSRLY